MGQAIRHEECRALDWTAITLPLGPVVHNLCRSGPAGLSTVSADSTGLLGLSSMMSSLPPHSLGPHKSQCQSQQSYHLLSGPLSPGPGSHPASGHWRPLPGERSHHGFNSSFHVSGTRRVCCTSGWILGSGAPCVDTLTSPEETIYLRGSEDPQSE